MKFIFSKLFNWPGIAAGLLLIILAIGLMELWDENRWSKFFSHFFLEIGAVLLALSTLHIVYEKNLNRKIVKIIRNEQINRKSLFELGISKLHISLDDEYLKELFTRSNEIMIIKTFFPESDRIKEFIKTCLSQNKHFILYLLKPESDMLKKRSSSLGSTKDEIDGGRKVIEIIKKFHKWKSVDRIGSNSKIILFDGWPSQPILKFDDTILVGYYLYGAESPYWPWLEIEKGSVFYSKLLDQFERINRNPKIVLESKTDLQNYINNLIYK